MSEPNLDQMVSDEQANSPPDPDLSVQGTGTLGTLARLVVGGALLGRDAIGLAMASTRDASNETAQPTSGDPTPNGGSLATTTDVPRPKPSTRHLLIGALFDTGERIERRGESTLRLVGKATSPAVRWARQSRLTAPARHRFDALSARGEARIRRWVERGVLEEQRSRALLNTTVSKAANTSLDQVVDSPQVQGLIEEFVEAQGQSIGRRFLDELRALAVRADHSVARLAHRILRHPKKQVPPFPRAVPAPPAEPTPPPSLRGRAAGFVSRLLASIIDIIFISILIRATGGLLVDIGMVTGTYMSLPFLTTGDSTAPIHVTVIGSLLMSGAYFVFFWTVGGMTPGKALMGLHLVSRAGHRVSFGRSLVRLFGYWVSLLFYGLGFWWLAVDNWREGWHDKIARSTVIYAWDAHPSERSLSSLVGASEDPP